MSTKLRRGGMRRGTPGLRLRVGFLVIAFVLSVFGARLIQLQAVDPGAYAAMAAREGSVSIVLPATRGAILDRNGQPLAQSASGLMIVADPTMTSKNAAKLAAFLARRLGVDYFDTLALLRTKNSRFVYIDRQVPSAQATAVVADADSHGWGGLFTNNDPLRVYPQKDVAANLVGFLGTPNDDGSAHPLAGLEANFNTLLSGTDGSARYEVGAGNEIPLGDNTTTPPVNGANLTTTLDANMQFYTQRVLQQAVRGAAAKSGVAIVMDTRTGQLLAHADYPTYDASLPKEYSHKLYHSAALTDVYEPGSVEKTLTLSALMDAKPSIGPGTRLRVPGSIHVEDRIIHDYWPHGLLDLTLAGVIAKSSNVGTVLASSRLNAGLMRHYLTEFGLGERTNIGLTGESPGILPPLDQWTTGIKDRIAFGQSLSVNALQEISAVNTIANGGEYISPSLILGSATNDAGQTVGSADATVRRVISPQTAHKMTTMMEQVVKPSPIGVAPAAQVPGYVVAGKTGTAQEVGKSGLYDSTTVSFAGFAPADNPRFTIYVVIKSPKAGSGGGSTAGPVFSKLMAHALARYGVAPTGAKPSDTPVEW
ncbi:peptidoglycan D,D-transpeptidase FtsI family protein [Nocardioides ultimimeridianus]